MDFRSSTGDENVNRGTLMEKPKCPTSKPAPGRNCLCCQRLALREEVMGIPQMTPVLPTGVEIWKVKQLIKSSAVACSKGPSMGSLIIPPQDQTSQLAKILADEFESASNIQLLALSFSPGSHYICTKKTQASKQSTFKRGCWFTMVQM